MHKLVKISDSEPTAFKSAKQLCSAQCFLSSAETRWRSNHELSLLRKYTGTLVLPRVPVLESNVLSGPEKIRSRGQWSHISSICAALTHERT